MILGCTLHQTSKLVTQNDLAILNYPKVARKISNCRGRRAPFYSLLFSRWAAESKAFLSSPEATPLYQEHLYAPSYLPKFRSQQRPCLSQQLKRIGTRRGKPRIVFTIRQVSSGPVVSAILHVASASIPKQRKPLVRFAHMRREKSGNLAQAQLTELPPGCGWRRVLRVSVHGNQLRIDYPGGGRSSTGQ